LAPPARIGSLGECGYDAVEIASELDNDPNPAVWASSSEQSLPPRHWVGLSTVRVFDRQHDVLQRIGEVKMLCSNMAPSIPAEFNIAPIGTSDKKYHKRRR